MFTSFSNGLKPIPTGLVVTWLSLLGTCFAEGLEQFHETPDSDDQTIEQLLAVPCVRVARDSSNHTFVRPSPPPPSSLSASYAIGVGTGPSTTINTSQTHIQTPLKLYLLSSTYLINSLHFLLRLAVWPAVP